MRTRGMAAGVHHAQTERERQGEGGPNGQSKRRSSFGQPSMQQRQSLFVFARQSGPGKTGFDFTQFFFPCPSDSGLGFGVVFSQPAWLGAWAGPLWLAQGAVPAWDLQQYSEQSALCSWKAHCTGNKEPPNTTRDHLASPIVGRRLGDDEAAREGDGTQDGFRYDVKPHQ